MADRYHRAEQYNGGGITVDSCRWVPGGYIARTGLLEVHGDFRHPQTTPTLSDLLRKINARPTIVLEIKLYAAQLKTSETSLGYLIPDNAVRGAWEFICR